MRDLTLLDLDTLVQDMQPTPANELWVFGYGSLIWNPGFEHELALPGYLDGWARKMWQGNCSYRGCPKLPGRVATIHQEPKSRTYGMAFLVRGSQQIDACLSHLQRREIDEGYHYVSVEVDIINHRNHVVNRVSAMTVVAPPENPQFLGHAPIRSTARQIAYAKGLAEPNCDYLLNLAKSMRTHFPDVHDSHLFTLERLVREFLDEVDLHLDVLFSGSL